MFALRLLRKRAGMTMKELGQQVGVAESTISQYETGKRQPDFEMLLKLGEFFGVSADYLLTGDQTGTNVDAVRIPVLGSIPAGIPMEAIQDVVDWEELPADMARGGQEYFGLIVRGDSMYPALLPDDVVILRRTPCCESGDICAVMVNSDDATLKRVRFPSDGGLTIEPVNPNYSPRTFTAEEVARLPVTILGVVVELRRKITK